MMVTAKELRVALQAGFALEDLQEMLAGEADEGLPGEPIEGAEEVRQKKSPAEAGLAH